jgi:hypothetical protein
VAPPAGFTKYLGITSLSSYSVVAADQFLVYQPIEGLNISDLSWGTANAKSVSISFQVYSSLTGTFTGCITNNLLSYVFSYSITSANTWTTISTVIAGPTSGTWLTTSAVGFYFVLSFGSGSNYNTTAGAWQAGAYYSVAGATSVVGTNGATFYITGVQLEKGATATPFENRLYGTELALCQRYYWVTNPEGVGNGIPSIYGYQVVGNAMGTAICHPVTMRASPSATVSGTWGGANYTGSPSVAGLNKQSALVYITATSSAYSAFYPNNNGSIAFSAEL